MGSCPVKKDGSIGEPLQMWQNAANTNHLAAAFGVVERSSISAQARFRSGSTDSDGSSRFGTNSPGVDEDVSNCDWSTCTFQGHKIMREYSGGDVKISIPGEPAVFFFKQGGGGSSRGGTNNLELCRVEYTLCLDPMKNAVRLPTHLFGELAKSEEGRKVLEQHRVVNELAEVVKDGVEKEENDGEFLGSLWR